MYREFYGFNQAPFGVTPDPEFLRLSPGQEEALASIVYGVDQRKGFVLVLGDVGLGKTTILRFYLDKLATERLTTAYVFNPNVTFKALLDTLYRELDIADKPADVHEMVHRLHEVFIEEYRLGRTVVLIVDEAQNMPVETLENLRVLSNLETSTDKLLQMVLVGQPEFAAKLKRHELRQLRQRIAVRSTLVPFTEEESLAYIEHRLSKAGGSSASVFTRGALREIVKHARGVPRVINILCDNALVNGLGCQKKPVTAQIVREAIADLTGHVPVRWLRWVWASLVAVLAAGALFLASPYRELLLVSAETPVQLPAVPPEPPRALPVAAGGEDWVALTDEGVVAAFPGLAAGEMTAADASGTKFVATVVVQEGDTLFRLAGGVYGSADEKILRRILETNPGITDPDTLFVGTTIRFPAIRALGAGNSQLR
jgi:general secretion pathway protein A